MVVLWENGLVYFAFTWGVTLVFVEYFNGGWKLVMGMKAWRGFDFVGACIGAGSGSRIHKIRLIMW